MRNTIDLAPFARSTIGFDRLLDQLETLAEPETGDNYPPYNIERLGEDRYRVVLAVAGFTDNELSITVEANQLTVSGKKADVDDKAILYRGIAHRPFIRRFSLADYVVVEDAKLTNGLLTIELERQLPEAMKPRRIAINGHTPPAGTKHAA
ncbi:MAG TPA: Hsp20 family protein [Rhizomicrobium sp.]|jgi:molecular chaperone IbpA